MTIDSDTTFPELAEVTGDGAAWAFEIISDGPPVVDIVHESTDQEGRVWLEIRRDETRYVLRFPELADFVVTPSARRVGCIPQAGTGISTVRHLLLDQVVPHVLALDGSIVLHASAIVTTAGAVAFVGPSGFGKSSLAASFAQAGFPVLADDFVLLAEGDTGFVAIASYPGLRLWPDSVNVFAGHGTSLAEVSHGSKKQRVVLDDEARPPAAVPLFAAVVLGHPDREQAEVSVNRLSPRSGFMPLFEQAFRMERVGSERQLAEFDRFARLASSIRLLHLDYPREYDLLPGLRAELLGALALS